MHPCFLDYQIGSAQPVWITFWNCMLCSSWAVLLLLSSGNNSGNRVMDCHGGCSCSRCSVAVGRRQKQRQPTVNITGLDHAYLESTTPYRYTTCGLYRSVSFRVDHFFAQPLDLGPTYFASLCFWSQCISWNKSFLGCKGSRLSYPKVGAWSHVWTRGKSSSIIQNMQNSEKKCAKWNLTGSNTETMVTNVSNRFRWFR